jgi:internalin A
MRTATGHAILERPMSPPTDEPAPSRSKILFRARLEAWEELALGNDENDQRYFLRRGWDERRIFVVGRSLDTELLVKCTALRRLGFRSQRIRSEGAWALSNLSALTSLDLSFNRIGDDGAKALSRLRALTSLDLRRNKIGDKGAQALSNLSALTSLDLHFNHIGDDGAHALSNLTALTSLHVAGNNIGDEGASALAQLPALTSLDLGGNKIGDEGATALAQLPALTTLDLSRNNIGDAGIRALLDRWMANGSPIRTVDLSGNPSSLPPELLALRDARALLAAYANYRAAERTGKIQALDEAKLLVLGNEAVGKTSLIRFLVEGTPRNPDEQKTPGIATRHAIETRMWSPTRTQGTRLNIWDFGGQEVMHGTHKFFLTERSLYLLVLWNRLEDDESTAYEWLRIIANLGGDSPVIVVINQCDEGRRNLELNETRLRREFPSIVGPVLRTSCIEGDHARASIEALRRRIIETIATDPRLAHVRDPIPTSWLRVKRALTELASQQKVLTLGQFQSLCARATDPDEAITDPDLQHALLHLLHDLGVIVAHGVRRGASAAAREVSLLDPNWLTQAIYTLLNSKILEEQQGLLERTQLVALLARDSYPAQRHEFILDMMEHEDVGLCFEVLGSRRQRFLIPELLPANEPDSIRGWPTDSLRFRYEYELLPRRFLPRFIVAAHPQQGDSSRRWKTGVELHAAGCAVLVVADRDAKRVDIQVAGPPAARPRALSIVIADLDRVHQLNPEMKPTGLLCLPDNPEIYVPYDHVLSLERRHGPDYKHEPVGATREYSIRELLEGVGSELRPKPDHRDERRDIPTLPSPDVLLVVTTDVEFHAVAAAAKPLTGRDYREHHGSIRTYYDLGSIAGANVFVVETEMGSMRPGGSLSTVAAAIQELRLGSASGRRPASVIAVGIAFGINERKQAIGQVLVSNHLRTYDPERVGTGEVIPRGDRVAASTMLIGRMRAASKRMTNVKVEPGLLLSGEKLVDSLDYRTSLAQLEPEAIGGEMEGSGLYTACHDGQCEWLVVKAICDWGDGNKGQDKHARQQAAAANAAALVFAALKAGGFQRSVG